MRGRGATVVFSTHDMATAERMCDRIFMIFRGRKVLDGTLAEIQDQYGADTVRVRTAGGAAALTGMPAIEARQRFRPDAGGAASRAIRRRSSRRSRARTAVYHFEVTRPSLHDIFVRIAETRRPSLMHMNKTLIVAQSEFTTLVRTQGVHHQPRSDARRHGRLGPARPRPPRTPPDGKDRRFAVVDYTGVIAAPLKAPRTTGTASTAAGG